MNKLNLNYMQPQSARGYRYLVVPKELIENPAYSGLDFGAIILYAKMLERAGLSARNEDKFSDKNGRLFIIYTVEQMERDLQRSHPTIIKLTKQLADIGLIQKVRQGQGKPSKIYIMDFTSAPHSEPEKPKGKGTELQEVKDFNFKKSSLFNNTFTEIILDSGQRVGYRAYDDVLHLWRGAYTSREQEEYLRWENVASAIEGLMQDGLWAEPMEQLTLQVYVPEEPNQDEDYIPNLFDLAGSTIPLTSEPVESTVSIRPLVSQEVIDAALTLGANDRDSRLRIIAEFMKDKPLEENARFLQAHYKENGAGFYVGERKYSLWYDESGLRIAPGESAKVFTAAAVIWEQAAERIRELLDEGGYAGQAMLYRAWPFEQNRVTEALQYLHRDIDDEYKDKYLPTLTAALSSTFGYPDVVDKTKELLEQPEHLEAVIDEFLAFQKDYAHSRDILRFHSHRPDEIMQGLVDLRCTPLKFAASPDFAPVERFFISQDEIDALLREPPDHHDYRIGVYNFFEQHPDRKEREKYLSHLHGEYSGYHGGNDNITYTHKELIFTHGDIIEPYAAVKMKWSHVRKRIEELIKKDAFLSLEDRNIMESRTRETPVDEPSAPLAESEPLSEEDAKKHDILMANTKAHFASYDEVKQARPSDIVLFQRGDFFEKYGPDARVASVELDIHLTNRNIPELGRVAMCGVPAKDLDKYVEKLRKEHGVTISAVPENGTERQIYFLPSYSDMSEDKSSPSSKEMESEQVVGAAPQMVPDVVEYARIKERFPDRVVGVQNGDTIYFYGSDAEKVGPALNRNVLIRHIPGMGAVSITGDAESWQASREKLLRKGIDLIFVRLDDSAKYAVIISCTAAEYIPTGMELIVDGRRCRIESVDFQQDAVRLAVLDSDLTLTEPVSYVREYVEDAFTKELEQAAEKEGGKSFVEQVMEDVNRLTEQAPTIRELYEKYKALVIEALGSDQLYRNACKNSDKDTAYLEGDAAIKRAVLAAGDDTLTKLYFDNSKFHNDLHREALEETYPISSEPAQPPIVRDEPSDEPSAVPQPRAPLAPAYQVGDTVYLDNTAFTITNIGLFDIQLQDPTLSYPIFRSESKETFERLLRRDERNLPITDYLPISEISAADNGNDIRDVLTSDGGLLNEQAKIEVSGWLRDGVGNDEIARRLGEKFDRTMETMALETGEQVDYSIFSDRMTLDIQGKSRAVMMYDLRTVAGVLRAMYQQELGGFSHTPPAVEIIPASSAPQYTLKTESIYPAEKNNLPFDVVIETLHIDEPQRGPVPQNFHITDDNLGAGGAKAKYQMNMAALKTLHGIEAENRTATPEEQQTLSKYVGWGALADAFDESKPAWASEYKELLETLTPEEYESARASTLNSHYTSPTVIKAMYQALENMGFKGGNLLDESVPRLIQYNGTSHRETPGNKAFSRQAAHGSLFLLPESQSGGNM